MNLIPKDDNPIVLRGGGANKREDIFFSGPLKDYIFGRDMLKMPMPPSWSDLDVSKHYDIYNTYTLNNYNFRGPDFKKGVDVIAAGCSFTFGSGVPDNGTWPEQYSKKSGNSYVNLATPGASVEWIIENIYRYIENFGKPNKGILIMFPDLLRQEVLVDGITNRTIETGANDFVPQYYDSDSRTHLATYMADGTPIPNLMKKPFPIEYTILHKESIKRNVQKIRDFERYCNAANINLIWSTWSDITTLLYAKLPNQYKSKYFKRVKELSHWKSHFFPIEITEDDPEGIVDYKLTHETEKMHLYGCTTKLAEAGKCQCFTKCHFELIEEFPDSFHLGTDRWKEHGKGNAHYGVHRLIHIAEEFTDWTVSW